MTEQDAAICEEESQVTELVIMPDGRVFTFGTSLPVLEILKMIEPDNVQINALLAACADKPTEE